MLTDMMMGPMMGPMMGWAWMLLWAVFLVVLVVRALTDHGASTGSSAIRILEERFARGEIDRDEFVERKRALQS